MRMKFTALPLILTLLAGFAVARAQSRSMDVKDFEVSTKNGAPGQLVRAENGRLMINASEFRATLKTRTEQRVTVNFTYLGVTKDVFHLNSGEVRSQFGIKLRGQDTCNVVYVMWHFSPDQDLHVSVKRNPGKVTSQDCKDNGYINNIKPTYKAPLPVVKVDTAHTLSASMDGSVLTVMADGGLVWEGDLGPVALSFDGPVGMRSDNAHILLDYKVGR